MDPVEEFRQDYRERIFSYPNDQRLQETGREFLKESLRAKYSYNFSWMGRPVIQYPQDLIAIQELIFKIKPDCIIETGIAHGGSIIFSASMLELLGGDRKVVGIDIDIRKHNLIEIEKHPMSKRITMIEGPSTDPAIVAQVKAISSNYKTIMVILDSDHTHTHVLNELMAYTPFVSKESYCIVFDGIIELMPDKFYEDRRWGPGNNPLSAIREFLTINKEFEIDTEIESKLVVTAAPSGFLKKVI